MQNSFKYMWEYFLGIFDIPKPHEIRDLLLSALVAFALVFIVERLRRPKLKIEPIISAFKDQKDNRDNSILKVSIIRKGIKKYFSDYAVHNLKVFVSIYNFDWSLKCRYQSSVVGQNSLKDDVPEPYLYFGVNLIAGEDEQFSYIFKRIDARPLEGLKIIHEPDQYVAHELIKSEHYSQKKPSSIFLREDSVYRLPLGQYFVAVNALSDQGRTAKWFEMHLKEDIPVIRPLSFFERLINRFRQRPSSVE